MQNSWKIIVGNRVGDTVATQDILIIRNFLLNFFFYKQLNLNRYTVRKINKLMPFILFLCIRMN